MFCKIYLNFTEQYSFKVDRDNNGFASMTLHYWYLHIKPLIVVIWTIKSYVENLMFYFMQPLDVHWTSTQVFYQHVCSGLEKVVQWTYNMVHGQTDLIKKSYGRPSDEQCPLGAKICRLLHMHFGYITTSQNKNPSIRTQYTVKTLHGRCSTKEAISMLLSWST